MPHESIENRYALLYSVGIFNGKGVISLPDRLPTEGQFKRCHTSLVVLTNDKELFFCDSKICQIFHKGRWVFHSKLNRSRLFGASMVTLANGIYVFGSNPRCYDNHYQNFYQMEAKFGRRAPTFLNLDLNVDLQWSYLTLKWFLQED